MDPLSPAITSKSRSLSVKPDRAYTASQVGGYALGVVLQVCGQRVVGKGQGTGSKAELNCKPGCCTYLVLSQGVHLSGTIVVHHTRSSTGPYTYKSGPPQGAA